MIGFINLIKRFRSKDKAELVIESCVMGCHYDAARKYIELYRNMYSDNKGYRELNLKLQNKRIDSLSP